jgi:TonB family protein
MLTASLHYSEIVVLQQSSTFSHGVFDVLCKCFVLFYEGTIMSIVTLILLALLYCPSFVQSSRKESRLIVLPQLQPIEPVSMPVSLPPGLVMDLPLPIPSSSAALGQGGYSPSGPDHGPQIKNFTKPEIVVDTQPVPLIQPHPEYTDEARAKRIEGIVRLYVLVGIDGEVKWVRFAGHKLRKDLDEKAVQAAYNMRFKPAIKDGRPVAFWMQIEIPFSLNESTRTPR